MSTSSARVKRAPDTPLASPLRQARAAAILRLITLSHPLRLDAAGYALLRSLGHSHAAADPALANLIEAGSVTVTARGAVVVVRAVTRRRSGRKGGR
jgi:hypothetical protein